MSAHHPPYGDDSQWPQADWPTLESYTQQGCPCCQGKNHYSAANPPELAVRCHIGSPLYVAYWDGWLFLSCSECSKPVCKIKVEEKLI